MIEYYQAQVTMLEVRFAEIDQELATVAAAIGTP
jgi:hypothetical protein